MSEFINTADVIGDDEMCDQIIQRTVAEYKENRITKVGLGAFYGCTALVEVDIPNVTEIQKQAFEGCSAMTEINMPNVENVYGGAFRGCFGVKKLVFPKVKVLHSYNGPFADGRWGSRHYIIDFHVLESTGYESLHSVNPVAFIIRNTAKVCVCNGYIANWPSDSYIYVPKTMDDGSDGVAAYKAATNWGFYADQIRAIEDYTVDGTVMGDLDETKIAA